MSLHAGGVLPHGERHGALLGRHAPPVGLHLWSRPTEHQPIRVQGRTQQELVDLHGQPFKIKLSLYFKILLTEPPMNPTKNREKIAEVMFEKYQFHGIYVAIQAVLTLYAQGKTSHLCGNVICNRLHPPGLVSLNTLLRIDPARVYRFADWCGRRLRGWCHPHLSGV